MAASSACFVGIMMLFSVLGRTEAAASGISWAILTTLAMIGGGMIPLFVMPGWMRTLSNVSPVKWAILATEGAIWRGFGLAEMLPPVAVLAGVGAACFLLGAAIFRRRY
jgi:ABC-2 type transport system permease protein